MDPKAMITKIIRPDEVAEEGLKALTDDKDNQVKILVDMSKAWMSTLELTVTLLWGDISVFQPEKMVYIANLPK